MFCKSLFDKMKRVLVHCVKRIKIAFSFKRMFSFIVNGTDCYKNKTTIRRDSKDFPHSFCLIFFCFNTNVDFFVPLELGLRQKRLTARYLLITTYFLKAVGM